MEGGGTPSDTADAENVCSEDLGATTVLVREPVAPEKVTSELDIADRGVIVPAVDWELASMLSAVTELDVAVGGVIVPAVDWEVASMLSAVSETCGRDSELRSLLVADNELDSAKEGKSVVSIAVVRPLNAEAAGPECETGLDNRVAEVSSGFSPVFVDEEGKAAWVGVCETDIGKDVSV